MRFKTILPWVFLVLLLTSFPYLLAWAAAPAGKQFVGALVNPDDLSTYLSAMRQGGEGAWLFQNPFSPESWQPRLMLLPYFLVGKLAAFTGGSLVVWFHLFRLTAVLFTLAAILFWVRTVFPGNGRLQLTAWLLIVFGAGIGWLLAILGVSNQAPWLTPDLRGPEWTTFMALFHTPHFALGLGLEILLFACVMHIVNGTNRWAWVVAGVFASSASGLTYAYHIPVIGLVIGLFLLGRAWQKRAIPWQKWAYGLLVLLPAVLLLVYYGLFAAQDPYFAQYARFDNAIASPPPAAVFVGAGLLGILAAASLRGWFHQQLSWLPPIWAVTNILVLYTPFASFAGRFTLGLMVPVATMAAYELEMVILPAMKRRPFYTKFARFTPTPYATLRRVFLIGAIPTTAILPFWLTRGAVQTHDFPTYLPTNEIKAAVWLGNHLQQGDLVLAYYPVGNHLPGVAPGQVFVGQLDLTTGLTDKLILVEKFWQEETAVQWRHAFIDEWGIDYIYQGNYERAITEGTIIPPGNIIYEKEGVTIYRVTDQ